MATAQRIVLKIGTRVITHEDGQVALARLFAVVEAPARLRAAGRKVLVVSSGAVGLGKDALGSPACRWSSRSARPAPRWGRRG